MRPTHRLRPLLYLPGVLAAPFLVWLAITALRSAAHAGNADIWLMAWVLLFVVGLPLLLAGMALVGGRRTRAGRHAGIPGAGWKIP